MNIKDIEGCDGEWNKVTMELVKIAKLSFDYWDRMLVVTYTHLWLCQIKFEKIFV